MKRVVLLLFAALAWYGSFAHAGAVTPASRNATAGTLGRLSAIAWNDNESSGGSRTGRTLRIALVARWGLWYPDGPGTLGLPVEAFGERGRPLEIPGPLVRAALGTRVMVSIRNDLPHDLTIHGLTTSSSVPQTILHASPGSTVRTSFLLDRPGVFGYYGSDSGESLVNRFFSDAELSGAIVVDAPRSVPVDHIFVLGLYAPVSEPKGEPNFLYLLPTINGRSFPATEHLSYQRAGTCAGLS